MTATAREFDWRAHLAAALLVTFGLVPVLHRVLLLGDDAQPWWVLPLAIMGVIGAGLLLRVIGLRQGPGLALGATGLFAVLSLVLIWLNLDIPTPGTLTLMVAPVAVVLASLGAVAIVKWCDPAPSTLCGGFVLAVAVACTSILGPGLQESLAEAEARFAVADRAAAAGLPAYRIEVADWDVHLGSISESTDAAGASEVFGYLLVYERPGHPMADRFSIDVAVGAENPCEGVDVPERCEVVADGAWIDVDRDDLVVTDGGTMFTVPLNGETPDVEDLLKAIADKDRVTWHALATS